MRRRLTAGKSARRWLFLVHRWIGIASCLLFAMWFASGLVMMYVPYPSLSPAERLAGAAPIDWAKVDVPPPYDRGRMPRGLTLEMLGEQPVWRVTGWAGDRRTASASHRAPLPAIDAGFAERVAGRFARRRVSGVERIDRDQWTVAGGFDRHRPLWKATLDGPDGAELYVSSMTGAVVQATTRRERFWNWLGSIPHWLYPTVLRQDQPAWRQVVLWVSGPCIGAAVTGIWIGLLRTRIGARRYGTGRRTPYRGWMLWHHVAGLLGGVFLLAWVFSGWLSVDPGHLFRRQEPDETVLHAYAAADVMPALPLAGLRTIGRDAVQLRVLDFAATPLLELSWRDGRRRVLDPTTLRHAAPPPAILVTAARRLVPSATPPAVEGVVAPDAYWYDAPFRPTLRLRFADPAGTWIHLDPATGEPLGTLDRRRRIYRWAFDLLHKWDVNILTRHRPAWDLLLWLLSLAGLVTSVSGVWIGWRRLAR